MEQIRQMVLLLCIASVVAGVLKTLLPQNGLGSAMQTVIALFMIATILVPLTGRSLALEFPPFSLQELEPSTDAFEEKMKAAAISQVEATVLAVAEQQGISVNIVGIDLKVSDGAVWIRSVTLAVAGTGQQAKQLQEVLKQQIDAKIVVSWTDEYEQG